eukprot:8927479-Pyramimonas_sp.AAC.1
MAPAVGPPALHGVASVTGVVPHGVDDGHVATIESHFSPVAGDPVPPGGDAVAGDDGVGSAIELEGLVEERRESQPAPVRAR